MKCVTNREFTGTYKTITISSNQLVRFKGKGSMNSALSAPS